MWLINIDIEGLRGQASFVRTFSGPDILAWVVVKVLFLSRTEGQKIGRRLKEEIKLLC